MNFPLLEEIAKAGHSYAPPVGYGLVSGGAAYMALSIARGLRRGTNLVRQLRSPSNIAVGLGTGAVTAIILESTQPSLGGTLDHLALYAGMAVGSGLVGGALKPVYNALRTEDGITDDFRQHFKRGALRGALALPTCFGVLDVLSHYF